MSVAEKLNVTDDVPIALTSGVTDVKLSDRTHTGANKYAVAKVRVQLVTVPLPVVMAPAVSLPITDGDVPQVETVGVAPPVI